MGSSATENAMNNNVNVNTNSANRPSPVAIPTSTSSPSIQIVLRNLQPPSPYLCTRCSATTTFKAKEPTTEPPVWAKTYRSVLAGDEKPVIIVAIEMAGFRCPPDAGAAAKMKKDKVKNCRTDRVAILAAGAKPSCKQVIAPALLTKIKSPVAKNSDIAALQT